MRSRSLVGPNLPYHHGMVRRPLLAALAVALVAAACGGEQRGLHRTRRPTADVGDHGATPRPHPTSTEAPDATDPAPTTDETEADEAVDARVAGVRRGTGDGHARGARRLRRPRRRDVRAVPRPPPRRRPGEQDRLAARSTRAVRGSAAPSSRQVAEFILDEELLERFDIVGWDPRGTGYSEPAIDCIDDYDEYFAGYDITPDDEAERQQIVDIAEDFTERCTENNEAILEHVGTNNTRPRHGLDPPGAR